MESLRDGASVEIVPELAPVRIGRRPIPRGSYENTFDNRNESAPLTEDLEVPLRVARGAPRARRGRGQHLGAGDFSATTAGASTARACARRLLGAVYHRARLHAAEVRNASVVRNAGALRARISCADRFANLNWACDPHQVRQAAHRASTPPLSYSRPAKTWANKSKKFQNSLSGCAVAVTIQVSNPARVVR